MKILTHPNPLLRKKTTPFDVESFGVDKLEKLSLDMKETMYQADGVGLAAVQVGASVRLCVIRKGSSERYAPRESGLDNDLILVNPEIIERSAETNTQEEGCLSLPGVHVPVKRAEWIRVQAQDLNGERQEFEARDFFSRVVQHEIDHLDGILIIDKA